MITTTLTGKTRYRVQKKGLFSNKVFLVLQVELISSGVEEREIEYAEEGRVVLDWWEKNWRDAKVEDLLELEGMKGS